MRLINHSKWPSEKLKEMADFCLKPLRINAVKITVHDGEFHNGYWGRSSASTKQVHITTGGRKKSFPFYIARKMRVIDSRDRWEKYKETDDHEFWRVKPGYVDKYRENPHLPMLFLTREEYMLHIMAHELRHQWQHKKRPKLQYTYTARNLGRRSYFRRERDSDAFALRKLHFIQSHFFYFTRLLL
jgi:hypothetical protein